MKVYLVEFSITGRIYAEVQAENKEEVLEKLNEELFVTINTMSQESNIEITEQNWDIIEKMAQGNIREINVANILIEEVEE